MNLGLQVHQEGIRRHIHGSELVLGADGQINCLGEATLSIMQWKGCHLEDKQIDVVADRFDPRQVVGNHERFYVNVQLFRLLNGQGSVLHQNIGKMQPTFRFSRTLYVRVRFFFSCSIASSIF